MPRRGPKCAQLKIHVDSSSSPWTLYFGARSCASRVSEEQSLQRFGERSPTPISALVTLRGGLGGLTLFVDAFGFFFYYIASSIAFGLVRSFFASESNV